MVDSQQSNVYEKRSSNKSKLRHKRKESVNSDLRDSVDYETIKT